MKSTPPPPAFEAEPSAKSEFPKAESRPRFGELISPIRDEILRLTGNPDVKLIAEFEPEPESNGGHTGKIILFERKDGERFIGFSNLSPVLVKEMGIRTPFSTTNANVGLAMMGNNPVLDRYIVHKTSN